jgi:hypothetical protein
LRDDMATALQVAGAAAVAVGFGVIWLPLGLIFAGVFALAFGIAIERLK